MDLFYEPSDAMSRFIRAAQDPDIPAPAPERRPKKPRPRLTTEQFAMDVADLAARGITNRQQQAHELGMGLSTYKRRLAKLGLGGEKPSLAEWIPWTMTAEHYRSTTARKLRTLARVAQGRAHPLDHDAVVRWANELVEASHDISYSQLKGFQIVRANPEDWYLKRLTEAVGDLES
ncbi:hypothetical protein [Nonomuraea wenchangensis]|uniref:hypothetical protein n=1 Tax=Nonomuraea wenchangensis TaxID=568860 RepID=UPI0037980AC0